MSFDALGRGLTGQGEPTQNSYVHGGMDGDSLKEIEFLRLGPLAEADGRQIQVTTVVEQDIEKVGGSNEADSTRSLVRPVRSESEGDSK